TISRMAGCLLSARNAIPNGTRQATRDMWGDQRGASIQVGCLFEFTTCRDMNGLQVSLTRVREHDRRTQTTGRGILGGCIRMGAHARAVSAEFRAFHVAATGWIFLLRGGRFCSDNILFPNAVRRVSNRRRGFGLGLVYAIVGN